MKNLYLTRYAQSPFGKHGNVTLESMLREAGSKGLEDLDRRGVDHVAVAGLLAPLLSDQSLVAGLVAMDPAYTHKSIKGVANACDSGGLAVLDKKSCYGKLALGAFAEESGGFHYGKGQVAFFLVRITSFCLRSSCLRSMAIVASISIF